MKPSDKQHLLRCRAYSLVEMALSMTILAIVMASVSSAVLFASKAAPGGDNPEDSLIRDSAVLGRIAEDLAQAKYVLERTDKAITVVVPDRTGDGVADRIRYAWAGTSDAPLTYALNGGTAVELIESVGNFHLAYDIATPTAVIPPVVTYKPERLIAAFENTGGNQIDIAEGDAYGQPIVPFLPADVLGFIPTRVQFYSEPDNILDGIADITLSSASALLPTQTIYARGVLTESTMDPTEGWSPILLNNRRMVQAGNDISLVLAYNSGEGKVARIRTDTAFSLMIRSSNLGLNWSFMTSRALCYRLYGQEVLQVNSGYQVTRDHLRSVTLTLEGQPGVRSPVTRQIRLLQAPELVSQFWEADFNADPTTLDLNTDGQSDWVLVGGGSLPNGDVRDGDWKANGTMQPSPLVTVDDVLQVDLRLKPGNNASAMVLCSLNPDGGGLALPLIAELRDDRAGGQELVIYPSYSSTTPAAVFNGLPAGWTDLSLTLLPDENTVSISINGQDKATLLIERERTSALPGLSFVGQGGGAAFADIRVTTGGQYTPIPDAESAGVIESIIAGLSGLLSGNSDSNSDTPAETPEASEAQTSTENNGSDDGNDKGKGKGKGKDK